MKYLSSKPFTGGANSKAFVDRWEETFGRQEAAPAFDPVACDGVGDVSAEKDRRFSAELDRDAIMIGLVLRLKKAWRERDQQSCQRYLSLTMEEISSLLLTLQDLGWQDPTEDRKPMPKIRDVFFQLESPPMRWLIDAPGTFDEFFKQIFAPWVTDADTPLRDVKMIGRISVQVHLRHLRLLDVRREHVLAVEQFLGFFPDRNLLGKPRPKFQ